VIKNYEEQEKNYKKMCERSVATEKKIQEIKLKMEQKRLENKKVF
jgi:hypothetical protein